MAKAKVWTAERLAVLKQEWEEDPDAQGIADYYRLSIQRIYQLIHLAGVPKRKHTKHDRVA